MSTLLLQQLNNERDQYETIAIWDTDQEDHPPDPFLKIYPQEMWHKQSPQYFLERIDGPYTILTQLDREG